MKGVKGFQKGHKHSDETKRKIGLAHRRQVVFNCDFCNKQTSDKPSSYARKKRHFCSSKCYADYRKFIIPFHEQNSYRGVRGSDESKQVYHRRYCKNNPEVISHLKARRYAREKGAEGSHSLDEWQRVKDFHRGLCAYCKQAKKLTKDHIIPLSKGGNDYITNIQPLCQSCNSKKHNQIHQNPELLEKNDE